MKRVLISLLLFLEMCTGASRSEGASQGAPLEYADLYTFLESKLQAAEGYIASRWNGEKYPVIFSAELLAANSNQGEYVLREQAWPTILFNLDRMQMLGIRAVKIAVKYPILVPSFPRAVDYLALVTV